MRHITSHSGYWDGYAPHAGKESPEEALKDAFGWTQYPDHGPGDELLGDPAAALELGPGRGNAVAALALKGIQATGVDVSPVQCGYARDRWGHLPGAEFVEADVLDYLATTDRRWDAVYSSWGALWFTDPEQLLPLVHNRLTPGGRLVFSHAPPVPGAYGPQGMYGGGFNGRQIWLYQWAYEPDAWAEILTRHGFHTTHARVHPAPQADHVGTLIVQAQRPF